MQNTELRNKLAKLIKDLALWLVIAELIFWSPVLIGIVLAVSVNEWCWTIVTAVVAFWAGPFTPAIPLQIGLAIALQRLHKRIKRRRWIKRQTRWLI